MQLFISLDPITSSKNKPSQKHEFTIEARINNDSFKSKLVIDLETLVSNAADSNSICFDLFLISSYAYGIDRFIQREKYSIDGWSRKLEANLPLINPKKWNDHKDDLEAILSFISGDIWKINFSQLNIDFGKSYQRASFLDSLDQVNLLSGGLDSLIGAIDSLEKKKKVLFVSQHDNDFIGPNQEQKELYTLLGNEYKNYFYNIPSVLVGLKSTELKTKESTLRTRSLMFISLGIYFANSISNQTSLQVPENGSISLNFPLNSSRRTACSTRTTHPNLIKLIINLLLKLGIKNEVFNDYSFKTKGEMVTNISNKALLKKLVPYTNSCGKRGYNHLWEQPNKKIANHCGRCMPCVYRKASLISIERNPLYYGNKFKTTINSSKVKSHDLKACKTYLSTPITDEEISRELVANGLVDFDNLDKYVDLVKRTRVEVEVLFKLEGI